jgi:hypothetical protein
MYARGIMLPDARSHLARSPVGERQTEYSLRSYPFLDGATDSLCENARLPCPDRRKYKDRAEDISDGFLLLVVQVELRHCPAVLKIARTLSESYP